MREREKKTNWNKQNEPIVWVGACKDSRVGNVNNTHSIHVLANITELNSYNDLLLPIIFIILISRVIDDFEKQHTHKIKVSVIQI